ncbi:hypothetical protein FP2506_15749 [Fulvimarina pelagi HTCC2506]|uniref:VOC domain-containing protein n=1 Tax=Fulvimarina pelagi HTCC2506 TaxID=314231 RepID=Q0G3D0_9HYPH|nr:VOC family protein [Fulvimarina pelagi]EAU41901.1 hypothetical protein FP2506_15749 [Fulvimarina pelagi HTCC2506]
MAASEHPSDMPIHVASSELATSDLKRLSDWYGRTLGFEVIDETSSRTVLGLGGTALLSLVHDPDAKSAPRSATGLFHNAYVLPRRADLAAFLGHAQTIGVQLTGASDHLVTEAIYLDDPDGNGIEVYWDRPRKDWPLGLAGDIRMATDPLDLESLMIAMPPEGEARLPAGTRLGHIHLKVADLAAAESYISGVLGFAKQVDYPGAGFFGSGGYHHHVGANIWASRSGAPAPEGSAGLRSYTVTYADEEGLSSAVERCLQAGFEVQESEMGAAATDPWGIEVQLVAAS